MKVPVNVATFLVVVWVTLSHAAKLPSFIKACSRNDPDLNQCALDNSKDALAAIMEKGSRKFNIPPLDPLLITSMEINHSGLKVLYEDMKLVGMKDTVIKAIRIDLQKQHEEFDLLIPSLDITFKYKATGRVLVLPITGNGTGRMTLFNSTTTMSHDFDLKKKKSGQQHMAIKNSKFVSQVEFMTLKMENLFNGDRLLGDAMNQFMNENWKELYQELSPSFNAALAQITDQIYNGLTNVVPYDEMYPEKS